MQLSRICLLFCLLLCLSCVSRKQYQQLERQLSQMEQQYDQAVQTLVSDTDQDGVSDLFDQDKNTQSGIPVDPNGLPRDSDLDGVPDYRDQEIFSSSLYPVDETTGVAQVPPDQTLSREELQKLVEDEVKNKVPPVSIEKVFIVRFPTLHFQPKKAELTDEAKFRLIEVARILKDNPDMKITLTGLSHPETSKCNMAKISYRRAYNSIDFLLDYFGISINRLFLHYQDDNDLVFEQQKLNDRVEIRLAGSGEATMGVPDCND